MTNGSISYWMLISFRALSAVAASTAATAAIGSPTYRARSFSVYWRLPQTITLGASLYVMTARTPGSASALLVSMFTSRACACGLRRMRPTSMFGSSMSPVYLARPVTRSTASMFGPRLPTTLSGPPGVAEACCAMTVTLIP
jgi:hypothetical protein